MALEAYRWALKTGETFDRLTKIALIGQDRVGKISLRKYLRGEAEVVVKELLSSSKERSDRAQLFPGEGKKTRGSEKGDVPDEKKKTFVLIEYN